MDCHDQNEDKNEIQKKGEGHPHGYSMWMMILCCAAPVLALLLIPLIGGNFPALTLVLAAAAPFLCPVLMGGMMLFMFLRSRGKNRG